MGKSRRYKHVDRNAHRSSAHRPFDPSLHAVGAVGALAMPDAPTQFQSRYPAKKSKRARRAEITVTGHLPPVAIAASTTRADPPTRFDPQTIIDDSWSDFFLPASANDNQDLWCSQFLEWGATVIDPRPAVARIASPGIVEPLVPLPRSAAIAPWRRRSPLDVVALWLRAGWRIARPQRSRAA